MRKQRVILEIRQEGPTTSFAVRDELNDRLMSWLLSLAEMRKSNPAAMAAATLLMVCEDDEAAHDEAAAPAGATLQ